MTTLTEVAGINMISELIHWIRVGRVILAEWELSLIFNCYKGGNGHALERCFSEKEMGIESLRNENQQRF